MKKIIFLIIIILLLCGCEKKECKEYEEITSVCSSIMCLPTGKTITCFPTSRPCTIKVCNDKDSDKE